MQMGIERVLKEKFEEKLGEVEVIQVDSDKLPCFLLHGGKMIVGPTVSRLRLSKLKVISLSM